MAYTTLSFLKSVRPASEGVPNTALSRLSGKELAHAYTTTKESQWRTQGAKKALALFHEAARRVPAYKDFLRKQGIRAASVRTTSDFARVPVMTKENYINQYPLSERVWNTAKTSAHILAMSSGTTGTPTLWPRGVYQELEALLAHEVLFESLYESSTRATLTIIGFPMGVYVSGVATLLPTWFSALRGAPMGVVATGNKKEDVLRMVHQASGEYQQTLLIGHPFFIKDVLESGAREGIDWKKLHTRVLLCSEGFSESWRNYIASLIDTDSKASNVFSIYGSSELLLIGQETHASVALRECAERDPRLCEKLFGMRLPPNLFQFNPLMRWIESPEGELLFTSAGIAPLIRYNMHDAGSVYTGEEIEAVLKEVPLSPSEQKGVRGRWQLPFVALTGRSDNTFVYYAANIYPEQVLAALNQKHFLKYITGKCSIEGHYTRGMNKRCTIHVELAGARSPRPELGERIATAIDTHLRSVNSEYADTCAHASRDIRPKVVLWTYQHPKYFKPGNKPRYIIK